LDEIGDLSLDNQAKILRALEAKRFTRIGGVKEIQTDFRLVAASNKNLRTEIDDGNFRLDLYHRLRAIEILIPPLRDRGVDIPQLAGHFLAGYSRTAGARKVLSLNAMKFLLSYSWPGNARELKNVVETAALFAPTDTIDLDDVSNACVPQDINTRPLTLAEAENRCVAQALELCGGDVREAAHVLGVGRSTLYNKLSEYAFGHQHQLPHRHA
jgi:DNA-binding NtrC family response regulator